jgi:hypothetical protein
MVFRIFFIFHHYPYFRFYKKLSISNLVIRAHGDNAKFGFIGYKLTRRDVYMFKKAYFEYFGGEITEVIIGSVRPMSEDQLVDFLSRGVVKGEVITPLNRVSETLIGRSRNCAFNMHKPLETLANFFESTVTALNSRKLVVGYCAFINLLRLKFPDSLIIDNLIRGIKGRFTFDPSYQKKSVKKVS